MRSDFVNSSTPVSGPIRQRSRVLGLWPFISVLVHTKSAVRLQRSNILHESYLQTTFIISRFRQLYSFQTFNLAKKDFCFLYWITVNTHSQKGQFSNQVKHSRKEKNHLHLGGNTTYNKHFFPPFFTSKVPTTFISSTVPDKTLFRDLRFFS